MIRCMLKTRKTLYSYVHKENKLKKNIYLNHDSVPVHIRFRSFGPEDRSETFSHSYKLSCFSLIKYIT